MKAKLQGRGTSPGPKSIPKTYFFVFNKVLYNFFFKKLRCKNGFPIVFSQFDLAWGGHISSPNFFLTSSPHTTGLLITSRMNVTVWFASVVAPSSALSCSLLTPRVRHWLLGLVFFYSQNRSSLTPQACWHARVDQLKVIHLFLELTFIYKYLCQLTKHNWPYKAMWKKTFVKFSLPDYFLGALRSKTSQIPRDCRRYRRLKLKTPRNELFLNSYI